MKKNQGYISAEALLMKKNTEWEAFSCFHWPILNLYHWYKRRILISMVWHFEEMFCNCFGGKGAIKERLLIKVISTICCLIDGSCVWIIKVDYPRPWSFWHSWSQINYNCPPGHPQYKYASLEVASNWARMGHTHCWLTSITNKMY